MNDLFNRLGSRTRNQPSPLWALFGRLQREQDYDRRRRREQEEADCRFVRLAFISSIS